MTAPSPARSEFKIVVKIIANANYKKWDAARQILFTTDAAMTANNAPNGNANAPFTRPRHVPKREVYPELFVGSIYHNPPKQYSEERIKWLREQPHIPLPRHLELEVPIRYLRKMNFVGLDINSCHNVEHPVGEIVDQCVTDEVVYIAYQIYKPTDEFDRRSEIMYQGIKDGSVNYLSLSSRFGAMRDDPANPFEVKALNVALVYFPGRENSQTIGAMDDPYIEQLWTDARMKEMEQLMGDVNLSDSASASASTQSDSSSDQKTSDTIHALTDASTAAACHKPIVLCGCGYSACALKKLQLQKVAKKSKSDNEVISVHTDAGFVPTTQNNNSKVQTEQNYPIVRRTRIVKQPNSLPILTAPAMATLSKNDIPAPGNNQTSGLTAPAPAPGPSSTNSVNFQTNAGSTEQATNTNGNINNSNNTTTTGGITGMNQTGGNHDQQQQQQQQQQPQQPSFVGAPIAGQGTVNPQLQQQQQQNRQQVAAAAFQQQQQQQQQQMPPQFANPNQQPVFPPPNYRTGSVGAPSHPAYDFLADMNGWFNGGQQQQSAPFQQQQQQQSPYHQPPPTPQQQQQQYLPFQQQQSPYYQPQQQQQQYQPFNQPMQHQQQPYFQQPSFQQQQPVQRQQQQPRPVQSQSQQPVNNRPRLTSLRQQQQQQQQQQPVSVDLAPEATNEGISPFDDEVFDNENYEMADDNNSQQQQPVNDDPIDGIINSKDMTPAQKKAALRVLMSSNTDSKDKVPIATDVNKALEGMAKTADMQQKMLVEFMKTKGIIPTAKQLASIGMNPQQQQRSQNQNGAWESAPNSALLGAAAMGKPAGMTPKFASNTAFNNALAEFQNSESQKLQQQKPAAQRRTASQLANGAASAPSNANGRLVKSRPAPPRNTLGMFSSVADGSATSQSRAMEPNGPYKHAFVSRKAHPATYNGPPTIAIHADHLRRIMSAEGYSTK